MNSLKTFEGRRRESCILFYNLVPREENEFLEKRVWL